MQIRKNLIKLSLMLLILPFLASGCSSKKEDGGKLKVMTTIFPPYDIVRAITKEEANISMLLKPGADSHSFDPSPKDMASIEKSDIFIYVGGETWVDIILSGIDTKKVKVIRLMDYIDLKEEELVEGMESDHDHDRDEDHKEEYDEHIWTSPENMKKLVKKVKNELLKLDSKNKKNYEKNSNEYIEKLEKLDKKFKKIVENSSRKELIFADRFPFRYFTDEYDLKYSAAFSGCSNETEASAKTIAYLINKVKKEKIPVVFYLETSNGKMADTIVSETGAKKLLLHSAHNISASDFKKGTTYIDIMEGNLKNLKEALK
jgi:ABC-type metal ion transport system, periplasmic component/surface adhesin